MDRHATHAPASAVPRQAVLAQRVHVIERDLYPGDEGEIRHAVAAGCRIDMAGHNGKGLNLNGLDLTGFRARGSNMTGSTFDGATLDQADFTKATLHTCSMAGASLRHANLAQVRAKQLMATGADATGMDAHQAVMAGSSWNEANLTRANFTRSDIRLASFTGATISGATYGFAQALGSSFMASRGEGPQFNYTNLRAASFLHAAYTAPPSGGRSTAPSFFINAFMDLADTSHSVGIDVAQAAPCRLAPVPDANDITPSECLRMPMRFDHIVAIQDQESIATVRHIAEATAFMHDVQAGRGRPRSRDVHVGLMP